MKRILTVLTLTAIGLTVATNVCATEETPYVPSQEIRRSQAKFADKAFGIFVHWGIYSMFGQGEWYLNYGPSADEYAKAAKGFYPADFDARKWVEAVKESGAKYITITTRHHDGFSMFDTGCSDYDIVDATPFKRDIIKELADECHRQGIGLHLYYSLIDWTREDYPSGRTGLLTGRNPENRDYNAYLEFMKCQLRELLTNYGEIGAIWFDGLWDHDEEAGEQEPFDWRIRELYDLIHELQPGCLVGNNHHMAVLPGEDFQMFERDVPGENSAGYSSQEISVMPLETCQTMNGMWGYKIKDQDYKSVKELVQLLVRTASQGANLLLNVGPQPNGEIPAAALERMGGIGEWLAKNGETVYATSRGDFGTQPWGVATRKGKKLYLHVFDNPVGNIIVPLNVKVKDARMFGTGEKVKFTRLPKGENPGIVVHLSPVDSDVIDTIVEIETE